MFLKISKIFSREFSGINSAAFVLAISSLLSMALSLYRDRLLVNTLGKGELLDVYFAAFRLPDLLFAIFISLVSSFILIPFLQKKTQEESRIILQSLVVTFLIVSFVFVFLAFIFTPFYLGLFFPNLLNGTFGHELVFLTRVFLLQFVFLALAYIFMTLLQMQKKFVLYAFLPTTYTLSIIFSLLLLFSKVGIYGLAFGVVFGTAVYFVIAFIFSGFHFSWDKKINFGVLYDLFKSSYPRSLSMLAQEILVLLVFSSLSAISVGALSSYKLALALQSGIFSVIAISYSIASFPHLSDLFANGKEKDFTNVLHKVLRNMFLLLIPILALVFVYGDVLVNLVFGSKVLSHTDIELVSYIFIILTSSLLFQSFFVVLGRAFYARSEIWIPFWVYAAFIPIFLITYKLLTFSILSVNNIHILIINDLGLETLDNLQILLVSFALLLSDVFVAFIFLYFAKKHIQDFHISQIFNKSTMDFIVASVFSAVVSTFLLRSFFQGSLNGSFLELIKSLFISLAPAFFLFLLTLYVLGNLELLKTLRILKQQWRQIRN